MTANRYPYIDARRRSRRWRVGSPVLLIAGFRLASAAYAGGSGQWDPHPPIEASYSQSANYVGVGKQVTLSVGTPHDLDSWVVNGNDIYTAADNLTAHWTITCPPPGMIAGTQTGNSWTWTVPSDLIGTYTVDVSVDDGRSIIDNRHDYPWTASGSFTVCRVSGLVSDGVLERNKDGHYINLKAASGHTEVRVNIEPTWVQEYAYMLPSGFVTWTGGSAPSPTDQCKRWVSLTAVTDPAIKAKVGTVDEKAVTVHVVDAQSPIPINTEAVPIV